MQLAYNRNAPRKVVNFIPTRILGLMTTVLGESYLLGMAEIIAVFRFQLGHPIALAGGYLANIITATDRLRL